MNSQVQMGTVLNILFKMCKSLYKCLIIKTDSVKTWNSLVIIFCFVLYFDDFNFDVRVEKHAFYHPYILALTFIEIWMWVLNSLQNMRSLYLILEHNICCLQ